MRYFFFFQAEDGIRDIGVTGVQTCALPICRRPPGEGSARAAPAGQDGPPAGARHGARVRARHPPAVLCALRLRPIRRAACRGRVENFGGAASFKKKKTSLNLRLHSFTISTL